MAARRKKPVILKRTDHRLDMSPAGRNLFVSRDKQMQDRAARKIKAWMRVVAAAVGILLLAAAAMIGAYYLVPWFREELTVSDGPTPEPSEGPAVFVPPTAEFDDMGLPVYDEEFCLFVINAGHPAEESYVPILQNIGGVDVDARIAMALRMMTDSAKESGLALTFTEGYVSYAEQKKRFDATVKELRDKKGLSSVMANAEARSLQPSPGESDFQSGLCIRIEGDPETFDSSKTYSWLKNNMGKYGFVFRFPRRKSEFTGVEDDPTVIRYVGAKAAAAMQQRSMCLEEYLSYLAQQ